MLDRVKLRAKPISDKHEIVGATGMTEMEEAPIA